MDAGTVGAQRIAAQAQNIGQRDEERDYAAEKIENAAADAGRLAVAGVEAYLKSRAGVLVHWRGFEPEFVPLPLADPPEDIPPLELLPQEATVQPGILELPSQVPAEAEYVAGNASAEPAERSGKRRSTRVETETVPEKKEESWTPAYRDISAEQKQFPAKEAAEKKPSHVFDVGERNTQKPSKVKGKTIREKKTSAAEQRVPPNEFGRKFLRLFHRRNAVLPPKSRRRIPPRSGRKHSHRPPNRATENLSGSRGRRLSYDRKGSPFRRPPPPMSIPKPKRFPLSGRNITRPKRGSSRMSAPERKPLD